MNTSTQLFTRKSMECPYLETTFLDGSFRNAVILQSYTIGISGCVRVGKLQ